MSKIELKQTQNSWMAKFSGDGVAEIIELFGCDTIPTSFTALTSAAEVLKQIQKLNPLSLVTLAEG